MKSLKKAYLAWILGGLFGLHHLYLNRRKRALVWFGSLGGLFGLGCLYDLWQMPAYVREANADPIYIDTLRKRSNKTKRPSFIGYIYFGGLCFSWFYGFIVYNSVYSDQDDNDNELNTLSLYLFMRLIAMPFVVAIISYMMATEGPVRCRFRWPLLGSYVTALVMIILNGSLNIPFYFHCAFVSGLFAHWNLEWDLKKVTNKKEIKVSKRRLAKNIVIFAVYATIVFSVYSLYIWNNTTFEIDGKKILLKEHIKSFLNTQQFQELLSALEVVWNFYRVHGFRVFINRFYYGYDKEVIVDAYKVNIKKEGEGWIHHGFKPIPLDPIWI